jgi:hypothetical protein
VSEPGRPGNGPGNGGFDEQAINANEVLTRRQRSPVRPTNYRILARLLVMADRAGQEEMASIG